MQVYPTPTIGVLSTGDELVEPTNESLSRGKVLLHTFLNYVSVLCNYYILIVRFPYLD